MSKHMEGIKQRILAGEIQEPEFAAAKATNKRLPEDEQVSEAALAWRLAKGLRSRVTAEAEGSAA